MRDSCCGGATSRVLSVPRSPARGGRDRDEDRHGCGNGCGRNRVSGNAGPPAGVLRRQRQLQPSPLGRRLLWIRPVRPGRGPPRARGGAVSGSWTERRVADTVQRGLLRVPSEIRPVLPIPKSALPLLILVRTTP